MRALGAAFCFTALINPLSAQNKNAGAGTAVDGSGSLAKPVTTTITASNDALKVDIKDGSVNYWFYSVDAKGTLALVESKDNFKPTDPGSSVDLSLSAPGSAKVMLVIEAASDEAVVVSAVPDASSPTATSTKEATSTDNYAIIDINTKTYVDYELWTKADPISPFVKQVKQYGRKTAPTDLNLLNDMVLGDPDTYEIKVVVTSPLGDGSTTVSFSETKPLK